MNASAFRSQCRLQNDLYRHRSNADQAGEPESFGMEYLHSRDLAGVEQCRSWDSWGSQVDRACRIGMASISARAIAASKSLPIRLQRTCLIDFFTLRSKRFALQQILAEAVLVKANKSTILTEPMIGEPDSS
ncbi:MAG: hypothetical protein HC895_20395 [Leptolyngbyaceae cyanobacterium SM1_3_5]|nr:hypothetical protein [Leptolyngbyaceae cyanobacterium SM1_3_5]